MVSLLSRGVGLLAKSLSGLSCTQAVRCSSRSSTVSVVQSVTSRWFSKRPNLEVFPPIPTLDDPPKRPLKSFIRFMKDRRPMLDKQHPGATPREICKLKAQEWKSLSKAEKQVYKDAERADRLKYRETVRMYKENLYPHQLDMLKDRKKQEREMIKARQAKRVKRKVRELYGRPKQPRIAFNIFLAEEYHEAKGALPSERMTYMMGEWNKLPMTHKQRYIQLAQDDKVRYENQIKPWEEQMIEIGRLDLVRHRSRGPLLKKKKMEEATARQEDFKSVTGKIKSPRKHEE